MDITIVHYIAPGKAGERLQLHIHATVDLRSFTVSDSLGHSFGFGDRRDVPGDKIVLYTGKGTPYSIGPEENDDPVETIHVFYWDTDTDGWDTETTTVSISDGKDIDTYKLGELLYVPPAID
ncbi:hypothetical protein [Parapedobacter koreensis]|uniref:Uncharacterized protein n=1 Tax=Parapedobacter koreensis TaxID=332977 RepID=A0A1H7ICI6_9SPHI|nr:hypothetical protein [Parapedobacter koreensis]SEK60231.1 hypothetical protein SAMN05421740_102194 [Parapedobacter koreensis]